MADEDGDTNTPGRPGDRIDRIAYEDLNDELHELLAARYERLGYLGEFFRVTAHQPDALAGFVRYTESLKETLGDDLADVVALSAAAELGNRYEQNQHEQLAVRQGKSLEWVAAVVSGHADESSPLNQEELVTHRLTLALLRTQGHGAKGELEMAIGVLGPTTTVGVVLLTGRFAAHALIANVLEFAPPVPSVLDRTTETSKVEVSRG